MPGAQLIGRLLALIPCDAEEGDGAALLAAAADLAKDIDRPFEVVYVGSLPDDDHARMALEAGAAVAWLAQHRELGSGSSNDQLVAACQQALEAAGLAGVDANDTLVLCAAGPAGEELSARLAIRFGGVPLGRCAGIGTSGDTWTVRRAAYGGRAELHLSATTGPWFAAVRGGKQARAQVAAAGRVERLELAGPLPPAAPVREVQGAETRRVLAGARLVVAGGRGMGGEAGFALLQQLADQLGAALAGSLPTIDAGWVPVSAQVGQSGKFVTPDTYVAVGISGTPQHMAGIGTDSRIIAINSDPEADIFKVAEIGAVAKWEELLPAVLDKLQAKAPSAA